MQIRFDFDLKIMQMSVACDPSIMLMNIVLDLIGKSGRPCLCLCSLSSRRFFVLSPTELGDTDFVDGPIEISVCQSHRRPVYLIWPPESLNDS